jgi:hypothetical protein
MVYREPGEPRPFRDETLAEREARLEERALLRAIRLQRQRALERSQALWAAAVLGWIGAIIALCARWGMVGVFVGLEPLNLYVLARMWRSSDGRVWRRVLWTPVVLLPLYGPIAYGAFGDAPSEQRGLA